MSNTAANQKRSRPTGEAEEANKKRRKTNNDSSTAKVNKRQPTAKLTSTPLSKLIITPLAKPTGKPTLKRTTNKNLESKITKPRAKPRTKLTTRSAESLVDEYYFNASQQPNSIPEWVDDDIRVATPKEIKKAIEKKCVGWTDEALIKEREARRKKLWG